MHPGAEGHGGTRARPRPAGAAGECRAAPFRDRVARGSARSGSGAPDLPWDGCAQVLGQGRVPARRLPGRGRLDRRREGGTDTGCFSLRFPCLLRTVRPVLPRCVLGPRREVGDHGVADRFDA